MYRKDLIFKMMFALQVALLPIVTVTMLGYNPLWVTSIVVSIILLTNIVMMVCCNKANFLHLAMSSLASTLVLGYLLINFAVYGYLSIAFAMVLTVLLALANVLRVLLQDKHMPELVEAVDYCFVLFEMLAILALSFVVYYVPTSSIAMFALLLTGAVSTLYKLYYVIRFTNFIELFKRKK